MQRKLIESLEKVISINTNSEKVINFIEKKSILFKTIIPFFNVTKNKIPKFKLYIEEKASKNKVNFNLNKNSLELKIKNSEDILGYPLIYLIFYIFQRIYQEEGMYCIHGSFVSKNNKGVLLLGEEDYGKSRTTLKLCLEYKFKLKGDERIIIDGKNMEVVGGCNLIQISKQKLNFFFPKLNISNLYYNSMRDKIIIDVKKIGLWDKNTNRINYIFYTHICPYAPRFAELNIYDAERRIYELLSKDIRGVGYALLNLDYPLPSLDNKFISAKRLKFVKRLFNKNKIKTYFIRDNLENICSIINNTVFQNE